MTGVQAVVTGVGMVNALGSEPSAIWECLLAGRNGIRTLPDSQTNEWVKIAAPAVAVDIQSLGVTKRLIAAMPPLSQKVVFAGLTALRSAGLSWPEDVARYDLAAILGVGAPPDRYHEVPLAERNPKWFLETYPNVALGHLAMATGLTGFGTTIVSACTSSTHAIGLGLQLIRAGRAEVVLAGGADSKLHQTTFSGFRELNMSVESADANTAMRPFDRQRRGFVIGEGACFLVLESLRNAERRGARPRCFLSGYGASMNPTSVLDANRDGIAKSLRAALHDAKIAPDQIGYINAHGTSTISNDCEESHAIKCVFGLNATRIPINSTKSMLGHTFAACGAIESAVCVASLENQVLHPTLNFAEGDADCDLDYIPGAARAVAVSHAVNNTSGVGGTNATLVFSRFN